MKTKKPIFLLLLAPICLGLFQCNSNDTIAAPPTIQEVKVTEGTNMAAAISPDGTSIVIDLQGSLWVLPASGGEAEALTDAFGDARQPTWSNDGQKIAFQGYWEGNWHIYQIDKDGNNLEKLTSGPYDHREPAWSPDDKQLIFSSDRGGTYAIWSKTIGGTP